MRSLSSAAGWRKLAVLASLVVAGLAGSGPAAADPPSESQVTLIVAVTNCDPLVALGGPVLREAPDLVHTFWATVTVRTKPWRQDPNARPGRTGWVHSIDGSGVDALGQEFTIDARLYQSWLDVDFNGRGSITVTRGDGSRASGTGSWAAPIVDGGPADTLHVHADLCRLK
jgi:hypothetical protein